MTMDYGNHSSMDIKMPSPNMSSICEKTKLDINLGKTGNIKRSFDVAFLMLPDEKLKNKQCNEKQARFSADAVVTYPSQQISDKSDEILRSIIDCDERRYFDNAIKTGHSISVTNGDIEIINSRYTANKDIVTNDITNDISNNNNMNNNNNNNVNLNSSVRGSRYSLCQPASRFSSRSYDDSAIYVEDDLNNTIQVDNDLPKSAFTKVPHNISRQESPIPSSSPDRLSCPSSSPPVSASPPRHIFYQHFRPEYRLVNSTQFHTISQLQAAHNQKFKHQLMYRPFQNQNGSNVSTSSNGTGYLPSAAFPFTPAGHSFPAGQHDLSGIVRNPAAAALLTSLIPPTIATSFTLTAQNVCAKCNISFRMTSDLVYHMRSHHKSEFTSDTNRRKREEKLKCPVCNESFRERHHLTRHMTAHQDKASDEAETIQLHRRHK